MADGGEQELKVLAMEERARILLVEDEPSARQALGMLLDDEGYEVREARDGIEALEILAEWTPEVVLTDVRMPRLDGITLLDELHRRLPGVLVIVMTAFGSIEHAVETLRLGAADYLRKPVEFTRVLEAIARVRPKAISELRVGDRVAGRYEIAGLLGEGAMGKVYRATQLHLGREVALKVLTRHQDLAESRARFLREAQVAASLRHPHVVQIYDFGDDRGLPYLVMELLEGRDLRSALNSASQGWGLERTLRVATTVAGVLVETHRIGLVHRDLKPENIFLEAVGDREVVRVLDFGIAFIAGHSGRLPGASAGELPGVGAGAPAEVEAPSSRLTGDGMVVGTPCYIAPEQAAGLVVGPPADIYAFGCLLYEMVTGVTPFSGDAVAVMTSHLYDPPAPPSERGIAIRPRLEGLILGMLHKNPKWRPSARHVERELRAIAGEEGIDLALLPELAPLQETIRVIVVGRADPALMADLRGRGIVLDEVREISSQLAEAAVIYAVGCSLPALRELVATGVPVVADFDRGDRIRSVELRELGVAARLYRPVDADRLALEFARVVHQRRASERTTTLRLRSSARITAVEGDPPLDPAGESARG